MKKIVLMVLVAAFSICCIGLSACTKEKNVEDELRYEMEISLQDDILEGKETVSYNNVYRDGLNEAVFHLYANAYAENATHPAYDGELASYGGTTVQSVTDEEGKGLQFELSEDGEYLTVFHEPVKTGEKIAFNIAFVTRIPSGTCRLSKNEDGYALSSFYPQLSVFDDGFRKDAFSQIGDPVYSSCASYDVSFTCPKNMVVASSLRNGETVEQCDRQTIAFQGDNVRDFALCCDPNYQVRAAKTGDVTVGYFFKEDENPDETLQTAVNALKLFSEAFGEYPYETYNVVRVPFSADGMEFTGLVYVANDTTDVKGTVIHETAHQWWYGIVGSDCINESYMDEGLTTFTSAYYYLLNGEEEVFEKEIKSIKRAYTSYERLQQKRKNEMNLAMNKPIYDYTDYQYVMVEYNKGCMMFDNLYTVYGKEKFEKCLRQYVENNRFGMGGKDAFIAAAKNSMGDVSGLVEGWIGDKVVTTTFALSEE